MPAAGRHHWIGMEEVITFVVKPILMLRSKWSTSEETQRTNAVCCSHAGDLASAECDKQCVSCKGTHGPQNTWTRTHIDVGTNYYWSCNQLTKSWLAGPGFKAQLAGSTNSYFVI